MQLIYRGQTINYTPATAQPYRKPCALNWRFHAPGETYGDMPLPVAPYQAPRALNWRFQVVQ
ncbi:hypothetical protein BST81_02255 [Leptolyngbya sp. 'hensonii']|uniref:hypothetical protein n=1 Tax=Leptolyngbya sp. 'hensonii' TaxID=1922337 RepID=UPI00095001AE|nr:hypothetical protein [Leptolyngbya sp. 'hensonii']OLP20081.1 hypothetical protein BST81_02255 [Leptolyngbya sp. 'hensonii']